MKTILIWLVLSLAFAPSAGAQSPPESPAENGGAEVSAPVPKPKIVCPEPTYNFGRQSSSQTVRHDYIIRNEGHVNLEIHSVRASCGCTPTQLANNIVPPGGETRVHVQFDLRGRRGTQIKSVMVASNDPDTPTLYLQLRGEIMPGPQAQPAAVYFGRVESGASRSRMFHIESQTDPIQILDVKTSAPDLIVTSHGEVPDSNGLRHRFELTIADSLREGTVSGQITVTTDHPHDGIVTIPVAAHLVAPPAGP